MKLIEPKVELIKQEPGIEGVYKMIEFAGRNCYKSEPNENTTPKEFTERMINSEHGAMLEHGTMYFDVPLGSPAEDEEYLRKSTIIQLFKKNKYSKVNKYSEKHKFDGVSVSLNHYAITTNYRVFTEQIKWEEFGEIRTTKEGWNLGMTKEYMLQYLCDEPNEHHEKRITFKLTTDRGVTAEGNRHRVNSPAEESTRYCNYSKDKFGNEISIIRNEDIDRDEYNERLRLVDEYAERRGKTPFQQLCFEIYEHGDGDDVFDALDVWMFTNMACEWGYMNLLKRKQTPQQARRVLPLDLKSDIVYTAFESDWEHFLDLRYRGTTGKPHPDMYVVAKEINDLLTNRKKEK